jgi:hypothetical protein
MRLTDPPAGNVIVDAYAGYKGEETPRAFIHDGIRRQVQDILRRWYTDRHAYFRVRTDDQSCYVLRYDLERAVWELVMQEPQGSGGSG